MKTKMIMLLSLLLAGRATLACDVNSFIQSEEGQRVLAEIDTQAKQVVTKKLTEMGMSEKEFFIESRIPQSFILLNPNGPYLWSKFKIHLPKELKSLDGGILVEKTKKQTLDSFDRVVSEVCGIEITIQPGRIINKKSYRLSEKELVWFSSISKFIPLQ